MYTTSCSFPPEIPEDPSLVSVDRADDIVTVTIQRPDVLNCLSFATLKRVWRVVSELREDLSIRCVLFTGTGEKAFCAGADLKERKTMPAEMVPKMVRNIRGIMDDIENLPQPTIAVVNGFAFGGGTELMLACDLRVGAAHAQVGLTEVSLAIIPGAGGTQRLPRLIGKSRAKDLILTGRRVTAEEAERIGLFNRVAAKDEVHEVALEEGLEIEAWCYEKTLSTSDRVEALTAFAEKRKPVFKGE